MISLQHSEEVWMCLTQDYMPLQSSTLIHREGKGRKEGRKEGTVAALGDYIQMANLLLFSVPPNQIQPQMAQYCRGVRVFP